MPCPVCLAAEAHPLVTVGSRVYWRCARCQARFLDSAALPDRVTEKREYDRHENDPDDPGYRQFLSQLADPLMERIKPGSTGLDYGCGPGPALARMLEEAGFSVSLYDPLYQPHRGVLHRRYDFITCTEVVEHFHHPRREFERLNHLLAAGGWLGIMTRFQTDDERFANWHYRRDPTHVVFYRPETFAWLGRRFGWEVECRAPGIVLARKASN